jgi:hypothetical protein
LRSIIFRNVVSALEMDLLTRVCRGAIAQARYDTLKEIGKSLWWGNLERGCFRECVDKDELDRLKCFEREVRR